MFLTVFHGDFNAHSGLRVAVLELAISQNYNFLYYQFLAFYFPTTTSIFSGSFLYYPTTLICWSHRDLLIYHLFTLPQCIHVLSSFFFTLKLAEFPYCIITVDLLHLPQPSWFDLSSLVVLAWLKLTLPGIPLMVQWLRLYASKAGGVGSISGQGELRSSMLHDMAKIFFLIKKV